MDKWKTVPEMMHAVRVMTLKVSLLLLALVMLSRDLPSILGLVIGTLLSLWQFGSLSSSMQKAVTLDKTQAQAYAAVRYMLRHGIIALALGFAYFTAKINFATVVLGLFLVKIVIIGCAVREAISQGGAAYLRQLARRRVRKEG